MFARVSIAATCLSTLYMAAGRITSQINIFYDALQFYCIVRNYTVKAWPAKQCVLQQVKSAFVSFMRWPPFASQDTVADLSAVAAFFVTVCIKKNIYIYLFIFIFI